ncbi:MAG: hypothetical protein GXY58_10725 [Planctomycetaceae bacterium]|nr:hypothetical protein [Planctomycetaceae bacterium]
MITRIELSSFMSHDHTVIEPAAGLTVLIGPEKVAGTIFRERWPVCGFELQ